MADKLRIGTIGCGGMGRGHIRQMLAVPEAEIVALCDISEKSIERTKTDIPEVASLPVYEDYREMFDKVELDAVQIATPHTLHFPQAMDALDKGLHVMMEKPMVCTVDHAKKLIAKSEEKNRLVVIGYQRHTQSPFRYMRKVVEEGQIGEVTFISALHCQQWKKGTAGTWRQDPGLSGGGQLNDSGSHIVDNVLWITGLAVEELTAYIDNLGTLVDINSALTLKFKNGAQGTITVVGDAPCWHEDLTIWGETGVLFYRNGQVTQCGSDGKVAEAENLPPGSNPDQNLIDAILGRDKVWAPPICGLRVIELTEAAWKSAERGCPVKVESL